MQKRYRNVRIRVINSKFINVSVEWQINTYLGFILPFTHYEAFVTHKCGKIKEIFCQ